MQATLLSLIRFGLAMGLFWVVVRPCAAEPARTEEGKPGTELPATNEPDPVAADSSPERVNRLIRQLGDERFEAREEAQAELAKLGPAAFGALRAAAADDDLEIASRARYLLRLMQVDLTRPGDPAEVASLLSQFHLLEEQEQLMRLERLAALPEGQGLPALCRVIRFESSIVLAKRAALAIIKRYPSKQVSMERLVAALRGNLGESRRLPSRWLLSYARFHDAPRDAWREWESWTKKEFELWKQGNQETHFLIVLDLAAEQVAWIGRYDGAPRRMVEATRIMLAVQRRTETDAGPLIAWLVERKAWDALGLAPVAFARQFAGDPRALVYELAKKYEASGDRTLAETAAEKALGFEDGSARADQRGHYLCAEQLRMEGHFAWAEREYRRVTRSGNLDDLNVIDAYENLALMLHDRGENLRAAETLEQFAKAIKRSGGDAKVEDKNRAAMTAELNKYIVARMDYYQACHWRDAGDRTRQRLAIEAGLIQDPEGADLLIEAFKLPDADPIFREKIRKRIKNVALQLRMRVVTGSDPANACNELAWLIANTEGDLDEAIRLSRRSVDEQPENGAYYDTLARCYFAKGDHAKAVENQIKAFELEPHSGLIAKQLDEFRRAYEKKFGKPAPKPGPPRKKTPPAPQSLQQSVSPLLDYEQFGP